MYAMTIRFATQKDLKKIVDIYNQSIAGQTATADTRTYTIEEKQEWFDIHKPEQFPIFVYEINNEVAGWNSLSPYRFGRGAFDGVLETSYYIDSKYHRQGIAGKLMEHCLNWCKGNRVHTLLTFIMAHNIPSINLMKKYGFEEWGRLPQIAKFESGTFDHTIFGKKL